MKRKKKKERKDGEKEKEGEKKIINCAFMSHVVAKAII